MNTGSSRAPLAVEGTSVALDRVERGLVRPSIECAADSTHIHRILIASPNGPTVEGKCACGYTRLYSSSGDDEGGLWPAAMKAKRLKGGDVVKAKKGGARSVNQAQAFYGALT